ncbi:ribose-5-phosphate isomerase RpiA [Ornithinibacillus halotolerans]|uniref:Ribose-5-phosphate isomerase A n=1 Tax=Ornithinibacillus halotolerans TaxID=1274357 RepID=A0A916SAD5_9BACI|nr:ribose-5-phosphate isomerase RpiA [Ornithinibacillus halotolerans]GGA90953.1 ribose-5-phosphate isomerase A [Ornithinibacillus halotolerans]
MEQLEMYKKLAGEKAVEYIEDGMTIGLGSGSTVYWMMKKVSELVKDGLTIQGVPTSKRTEGWAKEFGIPLVDFSNVEKIDVAIDGADEIDSELQLAKGGGGSLVREKIVDILAEKFIVIADKTKLVKTLGKFPLPVEVVPFGYEVTAKRIANLGATPVLRMKDGKVFVSDNGNYILDCQFQAIEQPELLHEEIKGLVGVVETGLFVNMADIVIIGNEQGTEIITKNR